MSGIQELHLSMRQIFLKCLCSRRNEERIVLAPDRKQRRLRFAEIFLEFRIELYVRGIVEKQVELNFFVAWALEQRRIQRVGLRRDTLRIRYAVRCTASAFRLPSKHSGGVCPGSPA